MIRAARCYCFCFSYTEYDDRRSESPSNDHFANCYRDIYSLWWTDNASSVMARNSVSIFFSYFFICAPEENFFATNLLAVIFCMVLWYYYMKIVCGKLGKEFEVFPVWKKLVLFSLDGITKLLYMKSYRLHEKTTH